MLNIFYFQLVHADKEGILCVTTHSNNSLKYLERQTFKSFFPLSQYVNVNLNKWDNLSQNQYLHVAKDQSEFALKSYSVIEYAPYEVDLNRQHEPNPCLFMFMKQFRFVPQIHIYIDQF